MKMFRRVNKLDGAIFGGERIYGGGRGGPYIRDASWFTYFFLGGGGGVYSEVRAYIRAGALTGFCGTYTNIINE